MSHRAAAGVPALGLEEADLSCPICMSLLRDPFLTPCGHTFCFACVTTHLGARNSCPACSTYLTKDRIFPNFLLNKVRSCTKSLELSAAQLQAWDVHMACIRFVHFGMVVDQACHARLG